MKKILFLIIFAFSCTYTFGQDISLVNNSSIETSCDVSVDARYYLGSTYYLMDLMSHKDINNYGTVFIGTSSSNVYVYNPNGYIDINGGFQFASHLLPEEEEEIVCAFNYGGTDFVGHPESRDDLAAQVVYEIATAPKISGSSTDTFEYSTYYNENWEGKEITLNGYGVDTSAIYSEKECYNIYIDWCGDGVITDSEACDPGIPAGEEGYNSNCQSDCTIYQGGGDDCVSGGVTGSQSSPITSTTADLCLDGEEVGNFTANPIGNTTYYNWTCNGDSGGNCNATYTTGGGGDDCVSGGVTGTRPTSITEETADLCLDGEEVGNFTANPIGNTTYYNWSCDGDSGGNCNATYTAGGGGGGGGGGDCVNGGIGGNIDYALDGSEDGLCPTGEDLENFTKTFDGDIIKYDWICDGNSGGTCFANYDSGGDSGPPKSENCGDGIKVGKNGNIVKDLDDNETCELFTETETKYTNEHGVEYWEYVSDNTPTVPGCNTETCTYCGDGDLNDYSITGEECDFGDDTRENWCNQTNCKIVEETNPDGAGIYIYPNETILLGHNMGVFEYLSSSNAYIENNSSSDIYLNEKLCIYQQNFDYNSMSGNTICTSNIVGRLNSGSEKHLSVPYNRFVANTQDILNSDNYEDGDIVTTLESLENVDDTFLKGTLMVRVAKPTVNTVGGGASLLEGTSYSDVKKLSEDESIGVLNSTKNRNLILTSLGLTPLSSYTKEVDNSTIVDYSKENGNKDLESFSGVTITLSDSTIDTLPTQEFNGFDNVFMNEGNVTLSAQNITGGNKTFIVQNGNLTINGDLTSSDNILFVVKNGNIIIKNNVEEIDAILIDIGGKIKGETDSTVNRLLINGALYGNVDDILGKRTYIRDIGEYVEVGTNINFTSKIFTSPPPLLSQFLGEYMEGKKIPQ